MVRLADKNVRSALELVWDAAEYTGLDPFPREFLERLASLIPADAIVGYHEVEARAPWRTFEAVEIPAEGVPMEIQEAAKTVLPSGSAAEWIASRRAPRLKALRLLYAPGDAETRPLPLRVEAARDRRQPPCLVSGTAGTCADDVSGARQA